MSDVHANGLDVVIGLVAPHFLEDQRGGHGLPVTLQQAMEQFELQVRESHGLIKPDGFKALGHQGERPVAEDLVVVGGPNRSSVTATQQGFDPHLKFLQVEGFGQVIVGSGIETAHLVFGAAESREHQDRNPSGAVVAP